MRLDEVLIVGMNQTEKLPDARMAVHTVGTGAPAGEIAVAGELAPFRMLGGHILLPGHGGVNRRPDAHAVQGFDLLPQQIPPPQGRVRHPGARRIITHAVMALREERHTVHMCPSKHLREGLRIKFRAHIRNKGRGVEIQMYLTTRQSRPFLRCLFLHGV